MGPRRLAVTWLRLQRLVAFSALFPDTSITDHGSERRSIRNMANVGGILLLEVSVHIGSLECYGSWRLDRCYRPRLLFMSSYQTTITGSCLSISLSGLVLKPCSIFSFRTMVARNCVEKQCIVCPALELAKRQRESNPCLCGQAQSSITHYAIIYPRLHYYWRTRSDSTQTPHSTH